MWRFETRVKDSYSNPDNYFFVFDLWNDHGDGTYGDGVMNLSDIAVMASYLAEPVDQYQCYDHYPFFDCTPNTPPVITLIGDDPVYIYQWETYNDDGATADDAEDGDITGDIVTNDSVDTSNPGIYIVTYNVSDSKGAAAPEVTRTVIVQSQGGGDPICGNEILEEGEDCDGSAPEGYQCTDQCELIQIPPPPPPPPGCVGSCGGGGDIWPPTISNVGEGPQCELTTVTWKTSEDSISWVVYGTDENNLDQEYKSTEKFEEHSIVLPGLVSGTTYYYMVKAQNEHGISNNDNHSFTTPSSESCGEVLGEKIVDEEPAPISCDFFRPSGSIGTDADTEDVFAYPDGSLIRYECDHTMGVFAIREQMKWHVPTWQYLHDHYFGKRIYNISWGVFNGYPDYNEDSGLVAGVKVYSDGTLLRGSDKKVYIIESGHKRHIISLEELKKYTGKEIVNVSDDVLNQY